LTPSITWAMRDEFITDHVGFRLDSVDLERRDKDIGDDFDASYLVGSVRLSRHWDSTNEDFFPNEGRVMDVGLELGAADGFLAKLTGEANSYWRLSEKIAWATILRGGLMPYDADKVGVTERFFLGGDYDMRGFRVRGAGPKDPGDDDVATGGATKALVQNELRYRFNDNVYGLLFVDAGSLGEGPLEFSDWRLSAGAGIRVRIPFPRMTFSIEFANPLVSDDKDSDRLVHFRIGN
jgi:outer membrane protein assembly factor BamA